MIKFALAGDGRQRSSIAPADGLEIVLFTHGVIRVHATVKDGNPKPDFYKSAISVIGNRGRKP